MSDKKETDGGPAFPWQATDSPRMAFSGMTLRDYFAAKAMQAIIAHPHRNAGMWYDAAKDAYTAADAMLKARQQ